MGLKRTGKTRAKDEVDRLYDSFRTKNMSREEFRKRYMAATDPRRASRDLQAMVLDVQDRRTRAFCAQQKIDKAGK